MTGSIAGVVFDVDGTLADTLPLIYDALNRVLGATGKPAMADAEIRAMFGPSEEGIIAELMGGEWEDPFEAFLIYYEERHPDYVRPFPGVHDLLQWLGGQGARLGVVTGKGARTAEVTLRLLDLAGYFDVVEAGSPDGSRKPEALRRVMERWALAPGNVAYVGDSANDMAAARAVGAVGLGAAWAGEATPEALRDAGAAAVFLSPEDLHEWLQNAL